MARRVPERSVRGVRRLAAAWARRAGERPVRSGDRRPARARRRPLSSRGERRWGGRRRCGARLRPAQPGSLRRAAGVPRSCRRAGCRRPAEAAGPAAVARALLSELSGDDREMVAVLDSIPSGLLSRDWSGVVAFRLAIAHLTVGNEREMLQSATRCAELADGSTDRHVLALARWFAGDP